MGGTTDRRHQLRVARRRQILDAALRVFTEKGYHVTNVSDVAAEAGVSQGTIYWYFDSKEELFNAAIVEYFAEFGQQARSVLGEANSSAGKLRLLGEAMAGFTEQASGMFAMFLGYMASAPERGEAGGYWIDLLVEYKEALVRIIEQGVQSREFREVDAEALVWALMAAYDGLAAYLLLMPDLDIARISRTFVDAILAGVEIQAGP